MINELAKKIHENARSKGFWEDENRNVGEMLALIHAEVSEALEADRDGNYFDEDLTYWLDIEDDEEFFDDFEEDIKNTFPDELADVCIRVFDLAYSKGIDIEKHILAKMRYNSMRPHKHGKKY